MIIGEIRPARGLDGKIVSLIKNAIGWRDRWFSDPSLPLADIAKADCIDVGDLSRFLPLAYLAPDIVKAILEGAGPACLNTELLRRIDSLPAAWSEQRRLLGFQND